MINPLISVIVPIYNVEKYLDRCVNCLLNQKYDNYEIILVDDGSPDNCPAIIDEYAEKYDRIVAYHKKNGGLGDARNFGVQRAKGNWIIFVDSDDYVTENYISDLWDLKVEKNAGMVMCRSILVAEDDSLIGKKLTFDSFVTSGADAIWEVYCGTRIGWSAYNNLYPKEVLLRNPFPKGYFEDMACMYKIVDEIDTIAIGNFNDNYKYVQHTGGSILYSPLSRKHFRCFEICKEFGVFIDEKYPELNYLKAVMMIQSVVQILHRQQMSYTNYKKVFLYKRSYFRKTLIPVLKNKKIIRKNKVFAILLCTEPGFYKMVQVINNRIKGNN